MLSNKLTLILLLSGFFILTTCKKVEKVMMVKTGVASNITTNSADVSGQIIDIGEEATQYGHCYAKTPNVNKNNLITEKGKPTGNVSFTSSLTNLEPGTKYYVKAYISNKDGLTIYGDEIDLITLQHAIPEYISSVVENSTPTLLEMTYSLTLANIVPAASAFSVQVNSVGRTVNAVAISGNKVQLTLASAVVYGDIVTVAYSKPGSNPLQTPSGGQAASITAQNVTNNVSTPIPAYVSSVVENSTPTLLEMTYSLTLANIIPAASAFIVQVNSAGRTVNAVAISGTKVQLTLASAVIYGDIVTVAYSKPGSNPLQTLSGGQAASITSQTVTNNVSPPIPVYVSSVVENSTPTLLEMTYSLTLANIVPAASAFTVQVNSVGRTVNAVAISGNKVQLTLASAVVYGDIVTVAYIRPGSNPLQTLSGGQAASIAAQAVTNHVSPPIPVYVSSVVENATPTLLEMIYSLTLANIVPATSAFTVQVNSVGRTINTVVISGTKVLLTLSSPVVYGDIVTVAYTKPATNPLQTATGGQAVTISGQTVTNNTLCNAPSANTNVATDRGSSTVTFNGTVNANGSSTAVTFEYGTTISYGSEISATQSPITGTSNTSVNALVDGLIPFTVYHYRVKAINCGGTIYGPDIIFKTLCPSSLTLTHTAGSVAPVTKEVTYRIVQTSLTGEDKCWITQNLGADSQAGSEIDNTQAAAGWYWQFNRKQGYKYDGTRTPATTWITNISENSNWTLANDPCNQLLGSGWRIPTSMEWTMANNNGGWNNWFDTYSSVLKLHAQEGYLVSDLGTPSFLASYGYYWSTSENLYNYGWCLYFFGNESNILAESKAWGLSIRCLKD
jgi:uncharacterized repeat protein (TIGR02059 family)